MHCLSEITVKNFRSLTNAPFSLSEFTPLVGYNNGGKSNLLASIRWLLRPYSLSTTDFNNALSPVIVTGTVAGITPELLENLAETHRNRIRPFCTNGTLGIRRTQASPGVPVSNIVLEIRNPTVTNEDSEDAWARNPTGIDAAIKALFPEPIEIGAMEDATEDIGKSKSSSTIGKLIAEIMEPIEQQHGTEIRQTLDRIKQRLEAEGIDRAPELNQFDEGANDKLKDIFPGIKIRLHVPTPEIKTLFKDGTIKVFEEGETNGREINQVGHGAQRSIQMALVRYLAEMKTGGNAQRAARTLLLIDEPELYLHPQAIEQVRLALKALTGQGYQVIFATHSPQMIDKADIGNTLIICKTTDKGTHARKRLTDAVTETIQDAPSQVRILFELSNSSKILFSDHVLIVEGPTEEKLLPDIFHRVKGYTLSARKIALVRLDGSGSIAKGLRILDAIGVPTKALVDLDYAFRDAKRSGFLTEDDTDVAKCCTYCSQICEECGFTLAEDGFPKANERMTASDAFALLATHEDIKENIVRIHNKLRDKNVWLWKKGAFEDHLGIDKRGESAWAECAQNIQQNGCEQAITDYLGIVELLNWIDTTN
jgi:predicted ATP-dependent endonuclease of OLD family